LPRLKKFKMRDLDGNILFENEQLVDLFYPVVV